LGLLLLLLRLPRKLVFLKFKKAAIAFWSQCHYWSPFWTDFGSLLEAGFWSEKSNWRLITCILFLKA
jgi:hypothetical protein